VRREAPKGPWPFAAVPFNIGGDAIERTFTVDDVKAAPRWCVTMETLGFDITINMKKWMEHHPLGALLRTTTGDVRIITQEPKVKN
jgi:hypothetical protein